MSKKTPLEESIQEDDTEKQISHSFEILSSPRVLEKSLLFRLKKV